MNNHTMMNPNWPSRFTYYGRYEDTGVTDRVYEYLSKTGKKNLNILDVGCSDALATKSLKDNLSTSKINCDIIGVDVSTKVQKAAEENIGKFILGDILKIDLKLEFDIVICSKLIFFATAKRKATVLSKCSKFLKLDGGLITDAHNFEYPSILAQAKEDMVDVKRILFKLRYGPKASFHEWRKIVEFRFKRKVKIIIGKEDALKYSNEILEGWKKLRPHEKFFYLLEILVGKISAYVNREPNYKKIGKNISKQTKQTGRK